MLDHSRLVNRARLSRLTQPCGVADIEDPGQVGAIDDQLCFMAVWSLTEL